MLNLKKYSCGFCKTTPDQISHHKSHIETQKHKDKRELFMLKIDKLSDEELMNKYKTTNICDICDETETIINLIKNDSVDTNDSNNDIQDIRDIMEKQNSISNKEALKDKIHEIHNYLRNNGAGYGMNALKVFNILYGLKKIDDKGLNDVVGLDPRCTFQDLLSLANNNKDEELAEFIINDVLDAINASKIKNFLFYEIPRNMKGSVFSHLVREIDSITRIEESCNVLLSGKIYEYFIGRDESAISELGAYFTDRHIVKYIFDKLNPTLNDDGSVRDMIDMFGGSGGFTTEYINFLNEKYPNAINWNTELRKISHFDMNEDVIKSAGLEFFCLTDVIPDRENLKYANSFAYEYIDDNTRLPKKYAYPITNPPYGGDKNTKTVAQEKREKIKKYIKEELPTITDEGIRIARQKQLKSIELQEKEDKKASSKSNVCVSSCSMRIQKFARDNKLKGTDKEACSLMLLMDILEVGGTAIGVLKEGVFFNQSYKDIRRCLVENFNVREIISVPQNQFENTSTKTSIVIFDNTSEKTSEVKFYDLVVEKYEEDKFVDTNGVVIIAENKGDIYGVKDTLVSVATREEIMSNKIYSLNAKDYNKEVIVCGEGYELVRLEDICEIKLGTRITKKEANEGNIPVYGGGDITFYTDKHNRDENSLIISRYAMSKECVRIIPNKFYLNDSGLSIHTKNLKLQKYVNQYLLTEFNQKYIYEYCTAGSIQRNINMAIFKNLQIPIPKSEQKIKEWVVKISTPYDEKNSKQSKINELEKYIQDRIKDIGENEDCDEVELGSIAKINMNSLKKNQYEYINYIDISSVKDEKINSVQNILSNFPSRAKRIVKKYDILYSTVRPNLKGYALLYSNIDNCIASTGFVVITPNIDINPIYLYTLIKDNKVNEYLIKNATGSSYPAVDPKIFLTIKIKIPKNKQLIKDLEPTFNEIEKLQEEVKEAETLYNQLIKELSAEAIPRDPDTQLTEANVETIKNTSGTPSTTSTSSSLSSSLSSLSSTTVASLKEQCKSLGLKGYSKMNKADLIKLIQENCVPATSA
jgi:type I restriction enzyme S subunit